MNKGNIVSFEDLRIGDYFSDDKRQKYRKVPPRELPIPEWPSTVLNAFHIQSHGWIYIHPESKFTFVKSVPWNDEEKYGFRLSVDESELEYQLELLDRYLQTIDSILEPGSDDDLIRFEEIVHLLRSSFFVSLFSFCETQLNNQCRKSQQNNPSIDILLNDIPGKGINRAKTYMLKVLNSSFSFGTDIYWPKIQRYNKIRNCIVHNEGKMEKIYKIISIAVKI